MTYKYNDDQIYTSAKHLLLTDVFKIYKVFDERLNYFLLCSRFIYGIFLGFVFQLCGI